MKIETNIIISYIFPNKRYLKCVFICLLKIYQQDAEVNLDRFLAYGELYQAR